MNDVPGTSMAQDDWPREVVQIGGDVNRFSWNHDPTQQPGGHHKQCRRYDRKFQNFLVSHPEEVRGH